MGRPKGTKNKNTKKVREVPEVVKVVDEVIEEKIEAVEAVENDTLIPEVENVPVEVKSVKADKPGYNLVRTNDREIVVASNSLGFEVAHISGTGSPHNPKVFYLKVVLDKLADKIGEEKMNTLEPANYKEIADLIKSSEVKGHKEYELSGARRKTLNSEIKPSQFFDA